MLAPRRKLRWIAACAAFAAVAAGCGQLFDYPELVGENTAQSCSDGQDNDFDGKVDCSDPECASYCVENTEATCHDGVDNDQNKKIDCRDEACAAFCPEADLKTCSDRMDNDSDSKTDCEDPDCDGFCPEESLDACNDGRDNDGDGLIDAADPRCWLLLAPRVQRCAQANGLSLVENFDTGLTWGLFGSEWNTTGPVEPSFHNSGASGKRADGLVLFSPTPDAKLGTLVRQWAFSGSWENFELSFSTSVPAGTILRVAIVPVALAPVLDPPLAGAETALFSLTLDRTGSAPSVALNVKGREFSEALPIDLAPCSGAGACGDSLTRVRVVLVNQGLLATLTSPNGESVELLAGGVPSPLRLPASRLAFWGGSTTPAQAAEGQVALDDVRLRVGAERPCDFSTPQIPGPACEFVDQLDALGHVVSLAGGSDGEHCALVTASPDASVVGPQTLTAWKSSDGATWTSASSPTAPPVALPDGATLVGAGIAHDDQGWHAVVAYREGADVQLAFADAVSCAEWGEVTPGPTLFPDTEAPSYVIANGRHEVYFTRPPSDQTRRTLWRTLRVEPSSIAPEPELLAELPLTVGSPVSVQVIGAEDLVLVHPEAPNSGVAGVGFLVGDAGGRSWKSVDPSPLFALPPSLENQGEGRAAFDDRGITSAALSWSASGGFLLYGGSSSFGLSSSNGYHPLLSVGTARMMPAGQALPETGLGPGVTCGDGTCDAGELCSSCPADCPCEKAPLLADVFTPSRPWEIVSSDPYPARVQYLDFDHAALNWAGGANTWSVLPLDRAIVGDFELSFDLVFSWLDPRLSLCAVYIGLGTVPDPAAPAEAGADPASGQAGVFAHVTWGGCLGTYLTKPSVLSGGTVFEDPPVERGREGEALSEHDPASCLSGRFWSVETERHMLLRREGTRVSLGVTREDGCVAERTVSYSNALPELPALLVGFGGGLLFECDPGGGSGTITNLRLRLLDDPTQCPPSKQLCGGGSQEPTCVDTGVSLEHCGACGNACGVNAVCKDGTCESL